MSNLNEETIKSIKKIIEKKFQFPKLIFDEWITIFVNDETFDCKLESCAGYKEFDCNIFDRRYFDPTYQDGDHSSVRVEIYPVSDCITHTDKRVGSFDFVY